MKYQVSYQGIAADKAITLNGSKSISNRVLIIQALSGQDFSIENLSTAKDTVTLETLLAEVSDGVTLDAGAAGTTFRFLTAYLAFKKGTQILTGSARMKKRPIKVLVDVLRVMGAKIEYIEKNGYPPLKILQARPRKSSKVSLPADVSSQYISALMLIAPSLPDGLEINLEGNIVSLPYLLMTKKLMELFGAIVDFDGKSFLISNQQYQAEPYWVEGDWSAASYYYAITAFEKPGYQIRLYGIFSDSVQGDKVIAEIATNFGVETEYGDGFICLTKNDHPIDEIFNYDFVLCPDLAQTVSVMMAGLGVRGTLTGLQTLRIKETDRILALQQELQRVGVKVEDKGKADLMEQKGRCDFQTTPSFDTYEDHRMAMSFASLAIFHKVQINEPGVVSKSYPAFWEDLEKVGFQIDDV